MAERIILVCDVCGRPATTSVAIRAGDRNLVKDLCDADLREVTKNARTPKRGRKPASVLAAPGTTGRRGPGRPKGSRNKRSASKRSSRAKGASKRAGSARSSASSSGKRSAAKRSPAKRSGRRRSTAKS